MFDIRGSWSLGLGVALLGAGCDGCSAPPEPPQGVATVTSAPFSPRARSELAQVGIYVDGMT